MNQGRSCVKPHLFLLRSTMSQAVPSVHGGADLSHRNIDRVLVQPVRVTARLRNAPSPFPESCPLCCLVCHWRECSLTATSPMFGDFERSERAFFPTRITLTRKPDEVNQSRLQTSYSLNTGTVLLASIRTANFGPTL